MVGGCGGHGTASAAWVAFGAVCYVAPVLVWTHRRVGGFLTVLVSLVVGVAPDLVLLAVAAWVPGMALGVFLAFPVVVVGAVASCGGVLLWLACRRLARSRRMPQPT